VWAVSVAAVSLLGACSGDEEPASPATTRSVEAGSLADVAIALRDTGIEADTPIAIAQRPDSTSLLVAERGGVVVEATPDGEGFRTSGEVIDLREAVGSTSSEKGLLGITVSPDGSNLYASYTRAEDGASRVDEYSLTGDEGSLRADASTRRELVAIPQPFANHNGGSLVFGPDGMLYAGFGDGGSANDPRGNGQSRDTLLGKILRIDPTRSDGVPPDNPFASGGGEPEIWMTGLRNPWRISFDAETDDLWIGDVGQGRWEEVDWLPKAAGTGRGANLGWDLFEGDEQFPSPNPAPDAASAGPFTPPVFTYSHDGDEGGCSITGGYVYRGSEIPGLSGAYLFADYCRDGIRAIRLADGATDPATAQVAESRDLGGAISGVVSFFEDADRELYAISLNGTIAKLVPA